MYYYCIYVYIGGDMCAASWGRCSRGPGYVHRGFSVFSLFSFRWMGLGGGFPPVVLFLLLLCVFSSVSTKADHFMLVVTVLRTVVCVRIILLTVFCERRLLASFAVVDGLLSLCNFHFLGGWMASHNWVFLIVGLRWSCAPPVRVFLYYGFKYCIFSDRQSVIDLVAGFCLFVHPYGNLLVCSSFCLSLLRGRLP